MAGSAGKNAVYQEELSALAQSALLGYTGSAARHADMHLLIDMCPRFTETLTSNLLRGAGPQISLTLCCTSKQRHKHKLTADLTNS